MPLPAPPQPVWTVRLDTPRGTARVEIPAGEDYLIVIADHDPHPDDWQMVLGLIRRVCPAWPYALSVPEYDGRRDLWTAAYDPELLQRELFWP